MRRQFYILALFCTMSIAGLCQTDVKKDAIADFKKLNESFAALGSVSMDIQYRLFPTHASPAPVEEQTGSFTQRGKEEFMFSVYGTTTIRNREVTLVKDDSGKIFILKKSYSKEFRLQQDMDYAKLLELCSSVEKISAAASQGMIAYRFIFPKTFQGMDKLEVYIDPKHYMTKKVIMYLNQPAETFPHIETVNEQYTSPRLEIVYENIKVNPLFDKDAFSASKYVNKRKDKWLINPAYKEYELMDQTNIKLN